MASKNNIKGLNIQFSADTTAINKALSDVNKSLSSTDKELKQVEKGLKIDPKNTVLLAQKQKLLTDAINDTKKKLDQLNEAKKLADKDTGIDKQSKGYRDLERQIETTKQKLEQYNKESQNMGKGFDEASKSALSFGDVLKANVIADFVVSGLKAVANAIVQIGKSMFNAVKESGKFADDVNTMAKKFNLSTKEIQQYIRASDLIDVEVETIAKSMTKLTKAMNNPSTSVSKAFKEIGITVRDASGELRDSNEVFNEVIEALGGISNETQQDAYALEIFGKSASELGPLINGGAEELKKFNEYLEENNLLLSDEELKNLNIMNDSFDTLQATIEATVVKVSAELAPVITPLIDKLIEFINDHQEDLIEGVEEVITWLTSDEAKEFYDKFVDFAERTAQLVVDLGDIAGKITGLFSPLDKLLEKLKPIEIAVTGIVEGLKFILGNRHEVANSEANKINWFGNSNNGGTNGAINNYNNLPNLSSKALGSSNMTSNLTINIRNGNNITERQVRSWARIINDELGNDIG